MGFKTRAGSNPVTSTIFKTVMDYPELVNKSHIDKNEWTTIYTYTVKKADVTLDVYDKSLM